MNVNIPVRFIICKKFAILHDVHIYVPYMVFLFLIS